MAMGRGVASDQATMEPRCSHRSRRISRRAVCNFGALADVLTRARDLANRPAKTNVLSLMSRYIKYVLHVNLHTINYVNQAERVLPFQQLGHWRVVDRYC